MVDFLQKMLLMQGKLDDVIDEKHIKVLKKQKIGYLDADDTRKVDTAQKLMEETFEYVQTFKRRKAWNDYKGEEDLKQRDEELIDQFFFILKQFRNHGWDSKHVYKTYRKKWLRNKERQLKGVDGYR